jgi:hypothetical protein
MESAHDAKDAIMAYREEVVKAIMAYRAEVGEVIQAIPLQILREIENVLPLPTEQKLRGSKEIGNTEIDRLRAVEAALAGGPATSKHLFGRRNYRTTGYTLTGGALASTLVSRAWSPAAVAPPAAVPLRAAIDSTLARPRRHRGLDLAFATGPEAAVSR